MKFKENLQHQYVGLKSRSLPMEEFEFPGSMQGSKRMLITLPFGIQTNSVLLRMVSELPVIFPASDLMIAVPKGDTEVARRSGIHTVAPDLYAANWLGLPKKGFFKKIEEFEASVFIDFETHKNVFNALAAIHSKAGLRIGLAGVWGSPLHNFEIRSNFQHDELKMYRSMMDVLTTVQLQAVMPDITETS